MTRHTLQKKVILDVVRESSDHPSAETIYERAKKILPCLSLGTVYRNLGQMAQDGTIASLSADETRFDKTVKMHGHFVCKNCGKVVDIMEGSDEIADYLNKAGFSLDSSSIVFKGLCPECNKNKNEGEN